MKLQKKYLLNLESVLANKKYILGFVNLVKIKIILQLNLLKENQKFKNFNKIVNIKEIWCKLRKSLKMIKNLKFLLIYQYKYLTIHH